MDSFPGGSQSQGGHRGSFRDSFAKKFNMPSLKKANSMDPRLEQQMALPDDVPVVQTELLTVGDIVHHLTAEKQNDLNQVQVMELTDRIKANIKECGATCRSILTVLQSNNSKRILLAVELLELCSKNSDLNFHKYIGTKKFSGVFLKLLERKRGKGIKHKFYTKDVKRRWDKIEEQLLYLIQLWADTFMMMEDDYPGFQASYRQLRFEGIKFPMRDPNARVMMGNLVKDSPMFDYVEQIVGRSNQGPALPVQDPKKSKKQIKLEQAKRELEMQASEMKDNFAINDKNLDVEQATSGTSGEQNYLGEFESPEHFQMLALKEINFEDLEVVRSSLTILQEIQDAAQTYEDMQGELPTEITQTCINLRQKMAKMVQAKSLYAQMQQDQANAGDLAQDLMEQITVYLDMMDTIDNCLKAYRNQYVEYYDKKMEKIKKKQEKVQKKVDRLIEKEEKEKENADNSQEEKVDEPQEPQAAEEQAVQEEADNQNTDLLDFGGPTEPQEKPKQEEEKSAADEVATKPAKKFGGLAAPPKNSMHVLNNVRSLNQKLQEQEPNAAKPSGSESNPQQNSGNGGDDLMNLLMGIDFNEQK